MWDGAQCDAISSFSVAIGARGWRLAQGRAASAACICGLISAFCERSGGTVVDDRRAVPFMKFFTRIAHWQRWALAGVALTLVLVGCGSSTAGAPGAAGGDSTAKGGHHAALNEAAQIGTTWTMQLTAAKASQGTDTEKPNGGSTYLLCDLRITNRTSGSQDLYTVTTFTLLDAHGQLYTPLPLSFVTTPDGTLASGAAVSGEIAFMVPASDTQFTLVYSAVEGQGYWNISKLSS